MQNPWLDLPEAADFVLECDKDTIKNFNNKIKHDIHKIHLELLPEPYLGNPQAKVILLNLNPGFNKSDIDFHQNNSYFVETSKANLYHQNQEYPFYLLDPKNHVSPGSLWWRTKLCCLIEQYKYDFKKIANEICVIEYFPYHSAKFGFSEAIPSQKYSFFLVEKAMENNALIIQMRSKTLWQNINPHLKSYHNYYILRNPQTPAISPKNCPDGYPEILRALGK